MFLIQLACLAAAVLLFALEHSTSGGWRPDHTRRLPYAAVGRFSGAAGHREFVTPLPAHTEGR